MSSPPSYGSGAGPDAVSAHILAQPGVQRVPSAKLSLFIRKGFLDPATCAALCERVDATRRPSTISDTNGDPTYRTSETGDLDPFDPLVVELNARIVAFTGLDPTHGEPIQGQRYAVGRNSSSIPIISSPTAWIISAIAASPATARGRR